MTGDMAPRDRYYEQANPDLLPHPVSFCRIEVGRRRRSGPLSSASTNHHIHRGGTDAVCGSGIVTCSIMIEGDISQQPLTTLPGNIQQVDCLVFGDVLEHLVDPAAVLRQLLPWLKEDGQLLACIPNVQHWRLANLPQASGLKRIKESLIEHICVGSPSRHPSTT